MEAFERGVPRHSARRSCEQHIKRAFLSCDGRLQLRQDLGRGLQFCLCLRGLQRASIAIGVAAPQSLPSLAGVPTIASVAGLVSFDFESWSGVFVARRASAEAVDRLAAAMRRAVDALAYLTALTEADVTVLRQ